MDIYLLDQVNQEVKHLLKRGRIKIHGCNDGQKVTALDVFACALPLLFLLHLKEWVMTVDDKVTASNVFFEDNVQFSFISSTVLRIIGPDVSAG